MRTLEVKSLCGIAAHAEGIHEFPLDGLAQFALPEQSRILQTNAPFDLMLDRPTRESLAMTAQPNYVLRFNKVEGKMSGFEVSDDGVPLARKPKSF